MIKKPIKKTGENKDNGIKPHLLLLLIVVILLISVFTRIYWAAEKQGFHVDEVLSITMANHNALGLSLTDGLVYKDIDLQKKIFFDSSEFTDYKHDIKLLYTNNIDVPHTNFYYSLLRTSFLGRKVIDLRNVIYTGVFLNLIIFVIGFYFLYKLLALLFKDQRLILLGLFCAAMSDAAISNTLFLRPYQLQSTMLIAFTYLITRIILQSEFTNKMFAVLCIFSAGALLSGYFSIIYIGLFSLFILGYFLKKKDPRKILFFGFSIFLSTILTQIFYSKYWAVLLNGTDRSGEAYQKVGLDYISKNIISSLQTVYALLNSYAIYYLWFFAIFVGIVVIYKIIKKQKFEVSYPALWIILASIFFSIIVITLSPLKVLRYIVPVFPLIIMVIPVAGSLLKRGILKDVFITLIIVIFLINAFSVNRINYLFVNKKTELAFMSKKDATICVVTRPEYRLLEWLPYASDGKQYLTFKGPDTLAEYIDSSKKLDICNYYIIDKLLPKEIFNQVKKKIDSSYIIRNSIQTLQDDTFGFEILNVDERK